MTEDEFDEVVVKGKSQFLRNHDPFFVEGLNYRSTVVEDPTWWDVLRFANKMVDATGDKHHIYLEGIEEVESLGEVSCFTFIMGS